MKSTHASLVEVFDGLIVDLNVFRNIENNPTFLAILVLSVSAQILIIFFGGYTFKVIRIPFKDWIICLAFGSFTLVVGSVVRLSPSLPLPKFFTAETPETGLELADSPRGSSEIPVIATLAFETGTESKGHILWDRAIRQTKLRVRVVNAFKPRNNRNIFAYILTLRQ